MNNNETQILEKLQQNHPHGFRLLFNTYYQPLCLYAIAYLDSIDEAEEIVQETLIAFWEKKSFLNIKKGLKAYIFTSVKNAALNVLRQKARFRFEEVEKLALEMVECDDLEDDDLLFLRQKLFGSLEQLPPKTRAIFKSIVLDDLKHREVAELYGISINTVKTHYLRALKKLRGNLQTIIVICGYWI